MPSSDEEILTAGKKICAQVKDVSGVSSVSDKIASKQFNGGKGTARKYVAVTVGALCPDQTPKITK